MCPTINNSLFVHFLKVDAGVHEELLLLGRDGQSMLVVTYADVKVGIIDCRSGPCISYSSTWPYPQNHGCYRLSAEGSQGALRVGV